MTKSWSREQAMLGRVRWTVKGQSELDRINSPLRQ